MTTSPNIKVKLAEMVKQSRQLAYMTREQLFGYIADLVSLSDELINYIRDLDAEISKAEAEAFDMACSNQMNASLTSLAVKRAVAPFKADQEWARRQNSLVNDMRISALAAQRGAE